MKIETGQFTKDINNIRNIRMRELSAIIQSTGENSLLEKFGIAILCNQIIEEYLKNLIVMSNQINNIQKPVNFEKLTFGQLISKFNKSVIKLPNYNKLKRKLNNCNNSRNILIHNIFEIEYFLDIVEILDTHIINSKKLIKDLDLYRINLV